MMKNSKILIRIKRLSEIEEYKKLGITNFLFALEDFSIGYETFTIEELKDLDENIYLLLNRVLDNKSINDFKKIKDKLSFCKGIIFEDLGIYEIMKDSKIPLIWNQNHFAVNTSSINIWLDKVSSVIISNELEKSELEYILNNVKKEVILPVFGFNMAMYSRRTLLSFYNEYKNLKNITSANLTTGNKSFIAYENKYGTVLFYKKPFNLIGKIDEKYDNNIKFYYIDPRDLSISDFEELLQGNITNDENQFFENKTVYRIGDLND